MGDHDFRTESAPPVDEPVSPALLARLRAMERIEAERRSRGTGAGRPTDAERGLAIPYSIEPGAPLDPDAPVVRADPPPLPADAPEPETPRRRSRRRREPAAPEAPPPAAGPPAAEVPSEAERLAERLAENAGALEGLRERLREEEARTEEPAAPEMPPPAATTTAPESRAERRGILRGRPTPAERATVDDEPPPMPLRVDPRLRRLREGLAPREGFRVPSFEPEISDEMRHAPGPGNLLGIVVGSARFGRELLQGMADLVALLLRADESLRSGRARRWIDEVRAMDAAAWQEIILQVAEWSRDPRPLTEALWAPVFSILDHFRRGADLATEDQVESSAEIWQGTLETIDLLDNLAGIPELVEGAPAMAARLASARRRLAETLRSHMDDFRRLGGREAAALPPPPAGRRRVPRTAGPEVMLRRGEAYRERARAALTARRRRPGSRARFHREVNLRSEFRDWVTDRITATPGHPLMVLIDEDTGGIFRTFGRQPEELLSAPYMDAGHVASRHGGDAERFALEWSYLNQEASAGEGAGEIILREVVDIEGVPVELRTARMLEDEGFLPPGTVEAASSGTGWSMDDWRIEMTGDDDVYRWVPHTE